ncbi:hypothetical protein BLNAU_1725 [Blattamonas nauphoetae]|uniref:Uncharacterized protein n=1 Tax=Blattamonas nauphoetae TaxID=2049346 RepID=A0ABQ9YHG7_9EUKA|nr:hypothetical protein BLNAU_1725 [Blattamonas nauphoetae]
MSRQSERREIYAQAMRHLREDDERQGRRRRIIHSESSDSNPDPHIPRGNDNNQDDLTENESSLSSSEYVITSDSDSDVFGRKRSRNPLGLKRQRIVRVPRDIRANEIDNESPLIDPVTNEVSAEQFRRMRQRIALEQEYRKKDEEKQRARDEQIKKLQKEQRERQKTPLYHTVVLSVWMSLLFIPTLILSYILLQRYATDQLRPYVSLVNRTEYPHKIEMIRERMYCWFSDDINRYAQQFPLLARHLIVKAGMKNLKQIRQECHWYNLWHHKDTFNLKKSVPREPTSEEEFQRWNQTCTTLGEARTASWDIELRYHRALEEKIGVPL